MICLLFALPFVFTSCSDDDDDSSFLGAKINVTVSNFTGELDGVTVYMYKDAEITSDTKPENAKKQVVTDANGVAVFDLNFTELNILESQTTLYFAIFFTVGDQSYVRGSTGVTVSRNDVKNVEINATI